MPLSLAEQRTIASETEAQAFQIQKKEGGPLIPILEKLRAPYRKMIGAGTPGIIPTAPGTAIPGAPGAPTTAPTAPGTAIPGAPTTAPTDPMAMYKQALEGLAGGGAMLESSLADIETGKREAIGAGQQALVSAGLGGTTMMAGVPIQAEKGAGRTRLAARGQVEQLRLQTLASYAGLAQQAKLASAEREAALTRLNKQISAQEEGITATQKAEKERLQTQIAAQRRTESLTSMGISNTSWEDPFAAAKQRLMSGRSGLVLPTSPSPTGYESYVSGGVGPSAMVESPNIPRTMVSGMGPTTAFPSWSEPSGRGGAYAQQFPSIYGQTEEPVPQWM